MTPAALRRGRVAAAVFGLLLTAALAGCASIPLSTLWKMRSFDAGTLSGISPGQLRVAAQVEPAPMQIVPETVVLTLTLTPPGGRPPVRHEFGMRKAGMSAAALTPSRALPWQVFELDDKGLALMRRLQPQFPRLQEDYDEFAFKVNMNMEKAPAGTTHVILSVRLQLAADQAPLTLFDRARITAK